MNTEALIGKIGFLEGSHSNLWQVFSPFTICILFLPGCCFLLAHMPFPSPPFTKADTDDGFGGRVHLCSLLSTSLLLWVRCEISPPRLIEVLCAHMISAG